MAHNDFSSRHVLALLVSLGAAFAAWRLGQAVPPVPPPPPPVIHIHLMPPPSPVPPPPRPSPPQPPQDRPTPHPPQAPTVANQPHATMAADTSPRPPAPPAPPPPAQVIAPPAPPQPVDQSAAVEAAFVARIHAAIEAQKHYPMSKDARLEQPRGIVVAWVILTRDGTVVDTGIEQTRGGILDRQALETVRRAKYPAFPAEAYAGQSQHRFTASLDFIPTE